MKERSAFWDNYKGFLIITVVLGHALYSYKYAGADLVEWIYIFHMPAFVFTTGYLSRSPRCYRKESYLRLLLVYLLFNTFMMLFKYFYLGASFKLLIPYHSYWYLLAVVLWRLMVKPLNRVKGMVFISILVALMVGFYHDVDNTLAIGRTLTFLPFFWLGYKYDFSKMKERVQRKPVWRFGMLAVALAFFAALYMATLKYRFDFDDLMYSAYKSPEDLLLRILLMATAFAAILLLFFVLPDKKIPLMTNWGKNCLLIYLAHRPFTLIVQELLPKAYSGWVFLICLATSFVLLFVFGLDSINQKFNTGISKLQHQMMCNPRFRQGFVLALLLLLMINPVMSIVNSAIEVDVSELFRWAD